jgi:hypothetical protein
MMTALSNLDIRKYYLMHQVLALKDEYVLEQLEKWLQTFAFLQVPNTPLLHPAIKPLRKTISIEDLIKEQNYQGFDAVAYSKLCDDFRKEWDTEETIEELLAML